MQVQFLDFTCNNILISMMKDVNRFYSWPISVKELLYFPTMQICGSPVLNPLNSLVILFSIGNQSHCVMV